MSKIKIGIIGFGNWVKDSYLPALEYDGRAQVVAISAKSDKTIKCIESKYGDTIDVYNNYEDLLNSTLVDAVMIAVPDHLHGTVILKAIASGKPFFYEPPIGHTRELIAKVLQGLKDATQITHADLELALIPVIPKVSSILKTGVLGEVQSVAISLKSNWGAEPNEDTNVINRLTLWYVHVLNTILDATPKRVLILDGKGVAGRRQSQSTGIFDYNGIWGELKVNIDSMDELIITIDIVGSKGDIFIDILTGELKLRTKEKTETNFYPAKQPYADWPGMRECISSFLDAIETNTPSFANIKLIEELQAIGMATEVSKDTVGWAKI
ncbi:Gfo/Idh/MocA family oxidoreductase [Aquimarina sp. 2201CG1-2-11]|uniref:Gfo/Idh/MocA family protein n=1 Tax=Aquimarina discodermiae TaxID=3231043 RepID=UPI0034634625